MKNMIARSNLEKQNFSFKKIENTKLDYNVIQEIQKVCDFMRAQAIENSIDDETEQCNNKNYNKDSIYKDFPLAQERLSKYFDCNNEQVKILSYAFYFYFAHDYAPSFDSYADFLDKNVLEIVSHYDDFKNLEDKNLIQLNIDETQNSFKLVKNIVDSVLKNQPLLKQKEHKQNYSDFVMKLAEKAENRKFTNNSVFDLENELCTLESNFENLEFVQKTKILLQDNMMRFMFYDMCADFLKNAETDFNATLIDFYDAWDRIDIAKSFMEENHPLVKLNLVEFVKKESINNSTMTLTEKGKQIFLGKDAELYEKKFDENTLKMPEKIVAKKLFYGKENASQIEMLCSSLSEQKFREIKKRLERKHLPSGIAVLLYGKPGTGKTETVYQIARQTERAIFKVDISNTKSCWFGDSEKIIKKVFTDYKVLCNKAQKIKNGKTPILLFNECDAIFGKRKDVASSNTAQTENAIQNIILEEMENFSGIMIATTNLQENLDAAFERRFLFKIRFEKPSLQAKKLIWHSKIHWLKNEEAETLSKTFDFSGGEIENIARKATMSEIVKGSRPSFEELFEMCKTEKLAAEETKRVGFLA